MTNETEVDELRRNYRELRAPAYLKTRIRANLTKPAARPRRWLPAGALASLVIVVGLVFVGTPRDSATIRVTSPSLVGLSGVVPAKPKQLTLSLSGIRVPPKPTRPARPASTESEPQAGVTVLKYEQLS